MILPVVEQESRRNLSTAVAEIFPNKDFLTLRRMQLMAATRLEQLVSLCDKDDPPVSQEEIAAARKIFEAEKRDLRGLVTGKVKEPIPDENDLRIMIQCGKLATGPRVLIVTRDAHFLGYPDIIEREWRAKVLSSADLDLELGRWY